MTIHFWLVLHPDISRPIGGAKQMHRLAEAISFCGHKATIIQDDSEFHPGWFTSSVDTISYHDWNLLKSNNRFTSSDVLIFPETYIHLAESYSSGMASVIFNQNSSYTFGITGSKYFVPPSKVMDIYRKDFIKYILCISKYDYNFLSKYIVPDPSKISCIVNGLEDSLFVDLGVKKKRILYMPRKNALDAVVVSSLIADCPALNDWSVLPINGLPHDEVISLMKSSLLFLSFGHPEGFGLPVAEALASGCGVIGYSGLGGRELFKLVPDSSIAFEISVGDWGAFLEAILSFDSLLRNKPQLLCSRLMLASKLVHREYSFSEMCKSVSKALDSIELNLIQ